MQIICLFHPHTPSLSPSPARGMFRFGDIMSDAPYMFIHIRVSCVLKIKKWIIQNPIFFHLLQEESKTVPMIPSDSEKGKYKESLSDWGKAF